MRRLHCSSNIILPSNWSMHTNSNSLHSLWPHQALCNSWYAISKAISIVFVQVESTKASKKFRKSNNRRSIQGTTCTALPTSNLRYVENKGKNNRELERAKREFHTIYSFYNCLACGHLSIGENHFMKFETLTRLYCSPRFQLFFAELFRSIFLY